MSNKKMIQSVKGMRDFYLGRLAVFIDAANLQKSAQKLGLKVQYRRLKRFFNSKNKLVYLGYYTVSPETEPQKMFLRSLIRFGYRVVSKPLKIIRDEQGKTVRKANFDVEISVDATLKTQNFDTLILFSGDSDFNYLLEKLKKKGKNIVVISTRYSISRELIKVANDFVDLGNLKDFVSSQQKSPAFAQGGKSNLSTARNSITKRNKDVK